VLVVLDVAAQPCRLSNIVRHTKPAIVFDIRKIETSRNEQHCLD
jgi:hypothetical protein